MIRPQCYICGRWLSFSGSDDVELISFRKTERDLKRIEEARRRFADDPHYFPPTENYPPAWTGWFCVKHQDIADFAHLTFTEAMEAYKARECSRLRIRQLRVALLLMGIIAIVGGLRLWFLS